MSSYFIKHPLIAMVIAIVTSLLGVISMLRLPISEYPDIAPPTITLSATYPGADAQTVADSVATPIESQLSGLTGMDYMTSVNSSNGTCSMNVVFETGTNPDMDQVQTYMRYAQATTQLPTEVSQMGITIKKSTGVPLLLYSLTSPDKTFDSVYLANYAYVSLVDPVKRVPGVGDVQVFGAGRYAMRIWLDTAKMAQLGISVSDVQNAIRTQNTVNPGGQIGAEPAPAGQEFTYTVRTKGRLKTETEFENIIIKADGTKFVYLKQIAKVELGAQTYALMGRYNAEPSGLIAVYQAPGSNAIETVDAVKDCLAKYEKSFPPGLQGLVALDTTLSVRASIEEIQKTLIEALVLVVIVVFVFLQGWRATLIPAIAVPVSIVTTFCFFPMLGFTLNTVCLMGMVLAIGLVVDDAIVVVEAVESHMERGMTPRQASFAAMKEVSGPVVAIALVLAAVFLPSLLLPGITGTLFQQFAVTIAISMLISAFNALTLSPALSAILLRPKSLEGHSPLRKFYRWFNKGYDATAHGYARTCGFLSRKLLISIPLLAVISILIIPVAKKVPGGFLPEEDQGYLMIGMTLPSSASMQRTLEQVKEVEKIVKGNENVKAVCSVIGINVMANIQTSNSGFFFVTLKDWADRPNRDQGAVALKELFGQQLNNSKRGIDAIVFVSTPPAIAGVGTSSGITFILEDREGKGVPYLHEQLTKFIAAAKKLPGVAMVNCPLEMMNAVPQKRFVLDEKKCFAQGVKLEDAYKLLQAYYGSLFINYVTLYGQQWQVYIQGAGENRTNVDMLKNFYVRNAKGENFPLSALVQVEDIFDAEFVMHQNLYNAAQINISLNPGVSSAETMKGLERVFAETMPSDMGYEYSQMSYQEEKVQKGLGLGAIFAMSGLFAFLILAALYEKWALPLSVFLTVPIAVLGAFVGLAAAHVELNLYAQIGLVMLIGLAAKNAILIVEFAVLEMERGKPLFEATLSAAKLRLRPILMTSFAFILGCLPLVLASGPGASARFAIGIVVVVGMLFSTIVGCFLIPCSFVFVVRLFRVKIKKHHVGLDPDEEYAYKVLAAEDAGLPEPHANEAAPTEPGNAEK